MGIALNGAIPAPVMLADVRVGVDVDGAVNRDKSDKAERVAASEWRTKTKTAA